MRRVLWLQKMLTLWSGRADCYFVRLHGFGGRVLERLVPHCCGRLNHLVVRTGPKIVNA